MTRRMTAPWAPSLTATVLLWFAVSAPAQSQHGIIQTVQGRCLIVRDGDQSPVVAAPQGFVVAGDLITCQARGQLTISLPGSGRPQLVSAGQSYMVPATPRMPAPPAGSGKLGGRVAEAVTKCASPLGTLAVNEDRSPNGTEATRAQLNLPPPDDLLRAVVRESNCFLLVGPYAGQDTPTTITSVGAFGAAAGRIGPEKSQGVAADFSIVATLSTPEQDERVRRLMYRSYVLDQPRAQLMLFDNRVGALVNAPEGLAPRGDPFKVEHALQGIVPDEASGYLRTLTGRRVLSSYLNAYNKMIMELLANGGVRSDSQDPIASDPGTSSTPVPAMGATRQ